MTDVTVAATAPRPAETGGRAGEQTEGPAQDPAAVILRTEEEALTYIRAICFKTGPPRRVGVELEWTVHHRADPARPLDPSMLARALGPHTPHTLDPQSPQDPLPDGATVTVEPGGQVELSTPPHDSLAGLHAAADRDAAVLAHLLGRHDLVLGEHGMDPYRPPRRLLRTPRYDAMATTFAARGVSGLTMMCATAAVQVCLDAGQPDQVAQRWAVLHAAGPPLLALFANSRRQAGLDTGWASARMRAWLAADPPRTWPVAADTDDPASAWARYALAAPLMCLRRPTGGWQAPPGLTFGDWIAGRVGPPPSVDDLEYHLGTLFPPVRPRGYLEVRWLDAQPAGEWIAPMALLAGLLADPSAQAEVRALAAVTDGMWLTAAQRGLADPAVRAAAAVVADHGCRALARTGLDAAIRDRVVAIVDRRLVAGRKET